jgi:hypothetical protein
MLLNGVEGVSVPKSRGVLNAMLERDLGIVNASRVRVA